MDILIVPNFVQDAIQERLAIAFIDFPEASKDWEIFYHEMLRYFDEHGTIPEFTLFKKDK